MEIWTQLTQVLVWLSNNYTTVALHLWSVVDHRYSFFSSPLFFTHIYILCLPSTHWWVIKHTGVTNPKPLYHLVSTSEQEQLCHEVMITQGTHKAKTSKRWFAAVAFTAAKIGIFELVGNVITNLNTAKEKGNH